MLNESARKKSLQIQESSTPKIQTNNPGTVFHKEAHQAREIEIEGGLAEQTRQEILSHYNIDPPRAVSLPTNEGTKREMRAFIILENKKNQNDKYYADGHTAHAELLDILLKRFVGIGIKSRSDLPDNFLDEWQIKKGFIDPYKNGFKNFEGTHEALKKLVIQNQEANGLSEREKEELEKNPQAKLPDWFRSG